MSEKVTLNSLVPQTDGVYRVEDLSTSNTIDEFHMSLNQSELSQLSSNDASLFDATARFEQRLQLSPMRANFLRAFKFRSGSRVLELACSGGSITRYLAESGLFVDAIESDRRLAQMAALRTKEFKNVKIISHRFDCIDFESDRYEIIILNDICPESIDLQMGEQQSFEQNLLKLLNACKHLLSEKGCIFLTANNRLGAKYLFGASDPHELKSFSGFDLGDDFKPVTPFTLNNWNAVFEKVNFKHIHEYYLFPDLYFSKVLLGNSYVRTNQFAFQHLEGIRSQDDVQPVSLGLTESLLYQLSNANGYLGDFANSYLFVLNKDETTQMGELDFAHFPDFNRRAQYLTIVSKSVDENLITRRSLVEDSGQADSTIEHQFNSEEYFPGIQLSVLWQRSFLTDLRGIKFELYLLDYFEYLKKLDAGILAGMNVDAISNNIVVNEKGDYHLVDLEWSTPNRKIKSDFVFYRAMIHFALRNKEIFHYYKWINNLNTLGDFVIHCFKQIGVNLKLADLQDLHKRDCEFLKAVMIESLGYQLSDPLTEPADTQTAITAVNWRYHHSLYQGQNTVTYVAKTDNEYQRLRFNLPKLDNKIECFRFYPFRDMQSSTAGFFGIDSVIVKVVANANTQRILLELDSSAAVNLNNIHKGVFYGKKQDDHLFMFNNNNTFFEFLMPDYQLKADERIRIEVKFKLSNSYDYELARFQFGLVEQQNQAELSKRDAKYNDLNIEFNSLNEKYGQVKLSRVWRLLEAYRDSFKITGYPEKNLIGKFLHMIKLFKQPD